VKYEVKTTFRGKRRVLFDCPSCAANLEAPLEEAGQKFPCPTCGHRLLTPGIDELVRLQQEEAAKLFQKELEEKTRRDEEAARLEAVKAAPEPPPRDEPPANAVDRHAGDTAGLAVSVDGEDCANCHRTIGALEKAFIWRDQVVCARCYETLREQYAPQALQYAGPPLARPARTAKPGDSAGFLIFSFVMLGLTVASECGGAPGASWVFGIIWILSILIRVMVNAAR
jgi:DNA-directed RNA polymerase subunit RPC12/RpoP